MINITELDIELMGLLRGGDYISIQEILRKLYGKETSNCKEYARVQRAIRRLRRWDKERIVRKREKGKIYYRIKE